MKFSERDIGELIFGQQQNFIAASNFSRALDDDPVFSAVMVFLKRQTASGFDDDPFNLIAAPAGNAFVASPGPMDDGVQVRLRTAILFQAFDDMFDVLRACLGQNEDRIGSFYDNHVGEAYRRYQFGLGTNQATMGLVCNYVTPAVIVVPIGATALTYGIPGADIVPARVKWHDNAIPKCLAASLRLPTLKKCSAFTYSSLALSAAEASCNEPLA